MQGYIKGNNYEKIEDDTSSVGSLEDYKNITYLSDEELSNKYSFLNKKKTKKNKKCIQLKKENFV